MKNVLTSFLFASGGEGGCFLKNVKVHIHNTTVQDCNMLKLNVLGLNMF